MDNHLHRNDQVNMCTIGLSSRSVKYLHIEHLIPYDYRQVRIFSLIVFFYSDHIP